MNFWKDYSEEELNNLVEEIFLKEREDGFPFYQKPSSEQLKKTLNKLQSIDYSTYIEDDTYIKQSMHGLAEIWHYFPHSWEVQCSNKKTPMQIWENDDLFKKAILKRLKFGTTLSKAGIRKALKTASGAQAVSNFRPTAAAAIYDYLGGGLVYDMSSGYGGRLMGALTSNKVRGYWGVEPCRDTFSGLHNLLVDLRGIYDPSKKSIVISLAGSEEFSPLCGGEFEEDKFDICFTSPPYFNTEKYSDEYSQSYVKFSMYQAWLEGFIGETINNCKEALKDSGYLVYNVANTQGCKTLVEDVTEQALKRGFYLHKTLYLKLSSIMASGHKVEPVLIFKKL